MAGRAPDASVIVAAIAFIAAASPAVAQDFPPLRPSRDVAVAYRVDTGSPDATASQSVRMYWGDGGSKLRLEVDGQPGIGLVDFRARRMQMLLPQAHVFLEVPFNEQATPGFFIPPGATTSREGTDVVAGQRCTVWRIADAGGSGSACITGDGLLLRAEGAGGGNGQGEMRATAVTYGPQPASLFAIPPDFRRMDPVKPRQ